MVALLAVQSTEAFLAGMSWPALTLLFRQGLSEAELPAATCLETVIFASQVLLGTGLGMVLFHHLPALALLGIDALTFIGSLVMLILAGNALPSLATPCPPWRQSRQRKSKDQWRCAGPAAKTQPVIAPRTGGRRFARYGAAASPGAAHRTG